MNTGAISAHLAEAEPMTRLMIADRINESGIYDATDGFFYDRLTDAYVGWSPGEPFELKLLKQH